MLTLISSFFAISLLYSTVGFGGGTSYIAILALVGIPYAMIPKISLLCNTLVVAGSSFHYFKRGHFDRKLLLPLILSSGPMALLGGSFPLSEKTFYLLLSLSLLLCGIRLLFLRDRTIQECRSPHLLTILITGSLIGLLSGMVGIGGGIFLSPLLIYLGWARSKEAAAIACVFILVNSTAGLIGQLSKDFNVIELSNHLPLFLAVIIGGQIGSRIGTHPSIAYHLIQKGTAILTLLISMRLFGRFL